VADAKMRAAVFHGGGRPLVIEEVPRPIPGPGEALVRVAACGFCHTDLHYLDHGVPTAHPPPLVLGHEVSGTVEELGPSAGGLPIGARVLVPAVLPCGRCALCRTGRENICPEMRMPGNHLDGGFAQFILVPAKDLIPLPSDISLEEGSVIADALTTPYHAVVNRAKVRAGEWVVVVGCGGVGINAVQMAAASGAQVVAVDLRPEKLEMAQRLGARETLCPPDEKDPAKALRRITGGGADVAFEVVGSAATLSLALASLRRGGRLCLVGFSDRPAELAVGKIMFFEQELIGSLGCRPADYGRVIELVRGGKVQLHPIVSGRVALERVNDAAESLRRGEGFRTVVVPG
jgi:alcohol dehydrogenase, propanol-preferring